MMMDFWSQLVLVLMGAASGIATITLILTITDDLEQRKQPKHYVWFASGHWVHQADGWTRQEREDMRDYLMLTRLNKQ